MDKYFSPLAIGKTISLLIGYLVISGLILVVFDFESAFGMILGLLAVAFYMLGKTAADSRAIPAELSSRTLNDHFVKAIAQRKELSNRHLIWLLDQCRNIKDEIQNSKEHRICLQLANISTKSTTDEPLMRAREIIYQA